MDPHFQIIWRLKIWISQGKSCPHIWFDSSYFLKLLSRLNSSIDWIKRISSVFTFAINHIRRSHEDRLSSAEVQRFINTLIAICQIVCWSNKLLFVDAPQSTIRENQSIVSCGNSGVPNSIAVSVGKFHRFLISFLYGEIIWLGSLIEDSSTNFSFLLCLLLIRICIYAACSMAF